MADGVVTVRDLRDRAARFVQEREWKAYHNPKDLSIALSVEASELLEHFLWELPPDSGRLDPAEREAISDELADVIIYGLHLANALGVDLSEAVLRKIAKNEAKYPAERFRGRAREPSRGDPP